MSVDDTKIQLVTKINKNLVGQRAQGIVLVKKTKLPIQGYAELVQGSHLQILSFSFRGGKRSNLAKYVLGDYSSYYNKNYYIGKIGLTAAHGPYGKARVISRMRNGAIDDSYLVWAAGMADWLPVHNVINAAILTPRKTRKKPYQPGASKSFRLSRRAC